MRSNCVRFVFLVLFLLIPCAALATDKETDLTSVFIAGGVEIDRLRVYEVSGVLLIRGRTAEPAQADAASCLAASLGYLRVANLIQIVPALADDAIERSATHELKRAMPLMGCTFQVETRRGIVYLLGEVERNDQKDYAVRLIRRIDGVKEIRSGLTLLSAQAK